MISTVKSTNNTLDSILKKTSFCPTHQSISFLKRITQNSKSFHHTVALLHKDRAFVSTRPLVHKHVKISVDKWVMETTRPHKHVQIPEN